MSKILLRSIAIASLSAAALWAANFWESKSYTEWSPKEVEKLMTNSPWSQKVSVFMGGGGGGRGGGGGGGGGGGSTLTSPMHSAAGEYFGKRIELGDSGIPRVNRGGGGGGGDFGGVPVRAPTMSLFVRWFSSIPVKQALMRFRYGDEVATAQEANDYLTRQENFYVVTVAGLPGRMAGLVQRNPDGLKESTMLKRKKKEPINPDDIRSQAQEESTSFYFMFPKTDAITIDDKEVEFIMKTERFEVKRKFKLKNMVFNGELSM